MKPRVHCRWRCSRGSLCGDFQIRWSSSSFMALVPEDLRELAFDAVKFCPDVRFGNTVEFRHFAVTQSIERKQDQRPIWQRQLPDRRVETLQLFFVLVRTAGGTLHRFSKPLETLDTPSVIELG